MTLANPQLDGQDTTEAQQLPDGLQLAVAATLTAASMLVISAREKVAQGLRTPKGDGDIPDSNYGFPVGRVPTKKPLPKPTSSVVPPSGVRGSQIPVPPTCRRSSFE